MATRSRGDVWRVLASADERRPWRLTVASGKRQRDLEPCSLAGPVAVSPELSVVGRDDRLGDGQPDAASGAARGAGGVAPVEALEQLRALVRDEPFPCVGDRGPGLVAVSGGGDGDGAPFGGVP